MLEIIKLTPETFYDKSTVLREKSIVVKDFGVDFQAEVNELLETFGHWKIAVGLSAPQVGIKKRFLAINTSKDKSEPTLVIVNPILTNINGKKDIKKESCLSLPNVRGKVERRDKISIIYQNRLGEKHTLNADGFYARVILHEIDHLDGILFIDRMDSQSDLEPLDIAWE